MTLIRSEGLAGYVLLLFAHLSLAQTPPDRCSPDDPRTQPSELLPDLSYSCPRLRSGGQVLVAQTGEATRPTVLFIHGLGANAHRDWRYAYPVLVKQFHVVMLDLPGFGASDAVPNGYSFEALDAAVEEIVQRLSLTRLHLVGYSLGGAVSLFYADRHPQRIERLVLVDAAGVLMKQVFARQLLEASQPAGVGSLDVLAGILGPQARKDRVLDLLEDQIDVSSWLMSNATVRDAILSLPIHADAAVGLVEHDFTTAIRNVRAPTTLIWGREDTVTPLRVGKLLAARMPDARLTIVPDAQHMPMAENTAAFNEQLLRALASDLPPKFSPRIDARPQGDVDCNDATDVKYSGTIGRLSLHDCQNVSIENARLRELQLENSTAVLTNVTIDAPSLAIDAVDSSLTGTAMLISGETAVRAQDSRIDLAGVTVRARKRAIEMVGPSRIYFSVSDIDAPDYRGDAHFRWPPAAAGTPR